LEKALALTALDEEIDKKILRKKEINELLVKIMASSNDMPFSFLLIKPNGEIEWANDGFERLHGFRLDAYRELYGNTIYSLDPSSEIANLFNKCLKEVQSSDCICPVKSKKGEIRWLQVFMNPLINADGLIEELIAVEIDITVFKNKESELNAQNKR